MPRQREFDMEEALDAATETFWRHGYEATSVADLMHAMGLHKGSVYKAFGSKHDLFMRVFQRYLDNLLETTRQAMEGVSSPTDAIQRFIAYVRRTGVEKDIHKGCLAVNTIIELAPHDEEIRAMAERHHARVSKALSEVLAAGQADGSFRTDISAKGLAAYLTVVAAGLVSTSKASFHSLGGSIIEEVVLSTLEPR